MGNYPGKVIEGGKCMERGIGKDEGGRKEADQSNL